MTVPTRTDSGKVKQKPSATAGSAAQLVEQEQIMPDYQLKEEPAEPTTTMDSSRNPRLQ